MRRLYTTAVWATLALVAPSAFEASLAGATDTPERTVPQGQDPPGADNGEQQTPRAKHKGVIPPPQTGDEGIYTQAPNPDAAATVHRKAHGLVAEEIYEVQEGS